MKKRISPTMAMQINPLSKRAHFTGGQLAMQKIFGTPQGPGHTPPKGLKPKAENSQICHDTVRIGLHGVSIAKTWW